eukprot:g4291.t1
MEIRRVRVLIFATLCFAGVFTLWSNRNAVVEIRGQCQDMIQTFMEYFERVLLEAGVLGPLYLFLVYLITTIFMLPLWGFHVTTGYAYGTIRSALLISVVQALCAGFAFANSRYFARPFIRGYLRKKYGNTYDAIDTAVSKKGLQTTILLRLSPLIPFGVNNYLCGCTDIELWKWIVGTWIGVLPGTTAYCYFGSLGKTIATGETSYVQRAVVCIQISAAIGLVYYLSRVAKDVLAKEGIGTRGPVRNLKKTRRKSTC